MQSVRFSIITVTYNCEQFLEETINSVLSQTYSNYEYIFVDGGSTDSTLLIIKRYAANDSRIRLISEPDLGISDAMNKGFNLATGDIVCFLHADDYYPDKGVVSAVAERFAKSTETIWVTGGMLEVDANRQVIRALPMRRFSRRRLLRNNIIYHPSTFVRRESLARAGGFDESLRYAMDYDLWLRLSALALPLEVARPLACFRIHAESISSVNRLAALDEEYAVRKRYLHGHFAICAHAGYQMLRRSYELWRSVRT